MANYKKFDTNNWIKLTNSQRKRLIKEEFKQLCNKYQIPQLNVIFEKRCDVLGNINYCTNVVTINENLIINPKNESNAKDKGHTLLATIHHEFRHCLQYYESRGLLKENPIRFGVDNEKIKIECNGQIVTASLYIMNYLDFDNVFLSSVYVLQPCE